MDELSLSTSGGTAKTTYFISGTYYNNKGILRGNNFNRIGARFNLTNTVSDKLQVGIKNYIGYTLNNQVPTGNSTDAQGGFGVAQLRSLPIFPIYKRDARVTGTDPFAFNPYFNAYGDYSGTNIALTQDPDHSSYTEANFRNTTNLFADYRLGRFLSYRLEYGIDFYSQVNKFYQSRYLRTTEIDRSKTQAATGDARVFFNNQNVNNILNYTRYLNEVQELDVSFVHNFQSTISYNNGARGEGLPNDDTRSLSQASRGLTPRSGNESQFNFNSYLAIANYKLKDRYIAQASVRYDGSSRLGAENQYGFFPAMGFAYILSEESALKKYNWLNFLKLKTSVGQTGNAAGINNFQSLGLYSSGGVYALNPTIVPKQISNAGLRWEKAAQFDMSLEWGLFKERISGSIGYFNKTSYDLLLNVPMPASSGITNTYYINSGRLRNRGFEFELSTLNIDKKNFAWKTSGNLTLLNNRLLSLGGLSSNSLGSLDYVSLKGGQISTFYLAEWAGVDPQTGDELIWEVKKDNYDDPNSAYVRTGNKIRPSRVGQIDSNRVALKDKPVMAKFYGGLTNTFTIFKNFEVSVFFTFSIGNYLLDQGERRQSYFSGSNNLRAEALNAWSKPGDVTDVPKIYYLNAPQIFNPSRGDTVPDNFWYNNDPMRLRNTTRFLHNASYVRLRTVNLSYNFPEAMCKRMRLAGLRAFVSAQNLMVWTRFPGWDPEVVGNLNSSAERNLQAATTDLDFPQMRAYSVGLNLTF
jgi:TonB-linked SusC/RagA family outer membrane protein